MEIGKVVGIAVVAERTDSNFGFVVASMVGTVGFEVDTDSENHLYYMDYSYYLQLEFVAQAFRLAVHPFVHLVVRLIRQP